MSVNLFNCGANVVSLKKDGKKFAMTCAWAMMFDYQKALMLLGEQSETSNHIQINDVIGVSALSNANKQAAQIIGSNHSEEFDKYNQKEYKFIDFKGVDVILNARNYMKFKVVDILHIPANNNDKLLVLELLDIQVNENEKFLDYSDLD